MKVIGFTNEGQHYPDVIVSVSRAELAQLTGTDRDRLSHLRPGVQFQLGDFVRDVALISRNRNELRRAADGLERLAEKIRQHDPMAYFLEPEDGGEEPRT